MILSKDRRRSFQKIEMNLLLLNGLLLLGLGVASKPSISSLSDTRILGPAATLLMEPEIPLKKCRYSRAYSMLQARCHKMDLDEIPLTLQSDIQVLDATVNRLRELKNHSLSRYTSLAYLYLGDNFIRRIESMAFSHLSYLQVLDLSKNGCPDLPRNLFTLPYLRTLYLSENELCETIFETEISSPIAILQLSRNKLTRIPKTGPLGSLVNLNVSHNLIRTISPQDLAQFCSLKFLDVSGNPLEFNYGNCECHDLVSWIEERRIQLQPPMSIEVNCSAEIGRCDRENGRPRDRVSNSTRAVFDACSNVLKNEAHRKRARSTWIAVGSCMSVFLLALCCVLYYFHRRNQKKQKGIITKDNLQHGPSANSELLNGQTDHS